MSLQRVLGREKAVLDCPVDVLVFGEEPSAFQFVSRVGDVA